MLTFESLKKTAAIFLLSVYLFSATNLLELLKINVVVQHFRETKQLDNSVSLFQFLVMHYVTDDHNDKDNERDKHLPFKSPDICISNVCFVSIACQFSSLNFQFFGVEVNDFFPNNDSFVIASFHALIWHPPQFS